MSDAATFLASIPARIATQGKYGLGDAVSLVAPETGAGISAGEQDFARANEGGLRVMKNAADVALGIPATSSMGAVAKAPAPPLLGPTRPQVASMPQSGIARARQAAQDMEDLGIRQHGPVIAQAARGGEGVGALAKTVESMPFAGRPLQRATAETMETGARAQDNIASGFAPSGNIQRAGQTVRGYFDRFKDERTVPRDALEAMDDASLSALASRPPRELGSLKTAADARYEAAWRLIPEWMRKGGSREANVRLMGDMPATREAILQMANRNLNLVNEQRLGRRVGVADETAAELPTRFSEGSIQPYVLPLRGGLHGRAIEDIAAGNWRGSLQTMRDLRSALRRLDSKMPDKEGNVGSKADLARLQSTILTDMNILLGRMIADARKSNKPEMVRAFTAAQRGFRASDAFYRRYKEAMDGIQSLTKATKDEQVIAAISNAAEVGPKGNMNLILQVRRMAPDAVIDDIASALIIEMGRPTKAASGAMIEAGFSPTKWAGAWYAMNPTARRALFGHRPELLRALEKFARVTQGMKDLEKLSNASRSGQHSLIGMAILAGPSVIAQNLFYGIAGAAGMYGIAYWMSSPYYVNWLTRATLLQEQMAKGGAVGRGAARAMADHVKSLVKAVKSDRTMDPTVARAILQSVGESAKGSEGQPPATGRQTAGPPP